MKPLRRVLGIGIAEFASAHPGRTDSSGGHTDKSTGIYHYHNGGKSSQPATPPAEVTPAASARTNLLISADK
jgi:hypothetical protein